MKWILNPNNLKLESMPLSTILYCLSLISQFGSFDSAMNHSLGKYFLSPNYRPGINVVLGNILANKTDKYSCPLGLSLLLGRTDNKQVKTYVA